MCDIALGLLSLSKVRKKTILLFIALGKWRLLGTAIRDYNVESCAAKTSALKSNIILDGKVVSSFFI